MLRDHVRAHIRVPAHDFPLLFGQRAGLIENVVSHSYLSEVVQRTSCANQLAFSLAQLELLTKPRG